MRLRASFGTGWRSTFRRVSGGLAAGYGRNQPAAGFLEARNDFGADDYGGPCPPRGGGLHHYRFRLMAISRPSLGLGPSAAAAQVVAAAQPYIIQQTELTGTYQR